MPQRVRAKRRPQRGPQRQAKPMLSSSERLGKLMRKPKLCVPLTLLTLTIEADSHPCIYTLQYQVELSEWIGGSLSTWLELDGREVSGSAARCSVTHRDETDPSMVLGKLLQQRDRDDDNMVLNRIVQRREEQRLWRAWSMDVISMPTVLADLVWNYTRPLVPPRRLIQAIHTCISKTSTLTLTADSKPRRGQLLEEDIGDHYLSVVCMCGRRHGESNRIQ